MFMNKKLPVLGVGQQQERLCPPPRLGAWRIGRPGEGVWGSAASVRCEFVLDELCESRPMGSCEQVWVRGWVAVRHRYMLQVRENVKRNSSLFSVHSLVLYSSYQVILVNFTNTHAHTHLSLCRVFPQTSD